MNPPSEEDTCPRCQMPRVPAQSGSITQWISVCKCDSLEAVSDIGDQNISVCADCGKRIEEGRSGSLTQWVFRADICSCKQPLASGGPVDEILTPLPAVEMVEETPIDVPDDSFPLERYLPLAVLGKGATGTVYRCRDRQLNKIVAVKTLHVLSSDLLILFQREAKATSLLNHPGIVQVMDFGATQSGTPYMVLEYVDGISLQEQLDSEEPPDVARTVRTFVAVCEALSYAHSKGVFHRDLKPSNILLENNGIRLIDFGVAVVKAESSELTESGGNTIIGTPVYMSPDQFGGLPFDARSEVYSFGCLLFEMLTGQQAFSGETVMETMAMHRTNSVPRLDEIGTDVDYPEELQTLVARCMAKEPDARFQSFDEVRDALIAVLGAIEGSRHELSPEKTKSSRSLSLLRIGLAWLTLLVVASVGFGFLDSGFENKRKELKATRKKNSQYIRYDDKHKKEDYNAFYNLGDELYSVTGAPPPDVGEGRFLHAVKNNMHFFRASNDRLVDEDLRELADQKQIDVLSVDGCSKITGSGLKYLVGKPIRLLEMEWCQLSDEGVDNIARFDQLELLNLSHVWVSTDRLRRLKKLKRLKTLHLLDSRLNDECIDQIAEIKSLRVLTLSHNWLLTYEGLEPLGRLPELKLISLTGNPSLKNVSRIRKLLPNCKLDAQFAMEY